MTVTVTTVPAGYGFPAWAVANVIVPLRTLPPEMLGIATATPCCAGRLTVNVPLAAEAATPT